MNWRPSKTIDALPALTESGLLPPGDYCPSEEDFKAVFVDVPESTTRAPIYAGWFRLRGELVGALGGTEQVALLDGSYTTSKLDPGDLDLAVSVPVRELSELKDPAGVIGRFLRGAEMKAGYGCDAYAVPILPEEHPAFQQVTVGAMAYWKKWFGRDRRGSVKGCVWANLT